MSKFHPVLARVTARIVERSQATRSAYLRRVEQARDQLGDHPARNRMSCGNLAHGFAASGVDKPRLASERGANVAIVTSYNDMLSAHQPYRNYPDLIKAAVRAHGATAQVAGGVPAMCDGVTQGQTGMELSLFSRDVVAMATAVALSHDMFDSALLLGVCDKIVPGLLIGALQFGHLPMIFVPAGPMPTGISNKEKARVRQLHAEGKVGREELLASESASYHSAGTCTFYGTANSNQMLMEFMGLHMPGAAFINPGTSLRDALTVSAAKRAANPSGMVGIGQLVNEHAIVNGLVGLSATGGSTNHAIHWVAVAKAAGILIDWSDLDELSQATPLLARVYPNGSADVNQFHAAGGLGFVMRELLDAGLLHREVQCVGGGDLYAQTEEPYLEGLSLRYRVAPSEPGNDQIVSKFNSPFASEGGLRLLQGNLGRAVVKASAVALEHRSIQAPAKIFHSQDALLAAFKAGALDGDFVAVIIGQGPRANGMPELHKLTPTLQVLQSRGQKVALLTDGRMSGASGSVLAAIHVSPEACAGGPIAKLRDGDLVHIDATTGVMQALVEQAQWQARMAAEIDLQGNQFGMGRELFALMRKHADSAESGGSALFGSLL